MKRYVVYFFATTDTEFVKIGYCKSNLFQRQTQIQTGCPLPIELLGIILCDNSSDTRKLENGIHKKFKADKTRGEWYRLTSEIAEYIEASADTESGKVFLKEDKERALERKRERHQNDPEFRERQKKSNRESYTRTNRYQNDTEFRERRKKSNREYHQRPEVKERRRIRQREYARKKRENQKTTKQQLTLF